ncbi:hypothetical protein [Pandoraea sp. NPDC090278]|uniref:hypothetical protein n=1 Tax=Pandoraea sp. NPDC090278 TaxID=3364391 RepID=UPI00383B4880
MRILSTAWELFDSLSVQAKLWIIRTMICAAIGIPSSYGAMVWYHGRIAGELMHCQMDVVEKTKSLLDLDANATVYQASASRMAEDIGSCVDNALTHPKGTVSFLMGEILQR